MKNLNQQTEPKSIQIFRQAQAKEPQVKEIFKHRISNPLSTMLTLYDNYYKRYQKDELDTFYWNESFLKNHDCFDELKLLNPQEKDELLEKCIIQYSKTTTKSIDLDYFFYSSQGFSYFLKIANQIIEDDTHKKVLDAIPTGYYPLFPHAIKLYKWYEEHSSTIAGANPGTFTFSPLRTFKGFIEALCSYYNTCKDPSVFYINSMGWFGFREYCKELYAVDISNYKKTELSSIKGVYREIPAEFMFSDPLLRIASDICETKGKIGVDSEEIMDYAKEVKYDINLVYEKLKE